MFVDKWTLSDALSITRGNKVSSSCPLGDLSWSFRALYKHSNKNFFGVIANIGLSKPVSFKQYDLVMGHEDKDFDVYLTH